MLYRPMRTTDPRTRPAPILSHRDARRLAWACIIGHLLGILTGQL